MPDDRIDVEVPASAPPAPGLIERLAQTARDARRLVYDHLELAALEAQRAADGLVRILCGAIVVSVLVVSAWIALIASGAIWATDAGMSLPAALLLAAVANLVAAAFAGMWMRSQFPDVMFAASLRQLRESAGKDDDENDPAH